MELSQLNLLNKTINNTAANIGFGVIGAGLCNLHPQQHGGSCSGLTESYLAFCCYLHHQFFNWASVPGGRFSNPPTTPSPARWLQSYKSFLTTRYEYTLCILSCDDNLSNNWHNTFCSSRKTEGSGQTKSPDHDFRTSTCINNNSLVWMLYF